MNDARESNRRDAGRTRPPGGSRVGSGSPPAGVLRAPPTAPGDPNYAYSLIQDVQCVSCGYNLRGLSTDRACPECATPLKVSLAGESPYVTKPESDSPLPHETACVDCGTILREQTTHGSCLTCRAPVWYSIHGTWLRACNPGWLGRLRAGVTLWFWMLVGSMILACVAIFGVVAWGIAQSRSGPPNVSGMFTTSMYAGAIFGMVMNVLYLVVAVYLTTPNPANAQLRSANSLARAIKGGYAIGITGSLAMALITLLELPGWVITVSGVANLAAGLAGIGLVYHLRGIAARIPSRGQLRSATIVLWGLGLSTVLVQIVSIVNTAFMDYGSLSTGTLPTPPVLGLQCLNGLFSIGWLVFTIWLLVLLAGLRSALSLAIKRVTSDRTANRPD